MLSRDRKPDPPWALPCLCLSSLFLRWPLGREKLRMLITTDSFKGDILSQDCQGKDRSCAPPVFVLAEALDKPPSRFHEDRCCVSMVTGLQQLSISLLPLETIASTQKVLADVASPRDLSKAFLSHPHSQISETRPPPQRGPRYLLLEAREKNGGRENKTVRKSNPLSSSDFFEPGSPLSLDDKGRSFDQNGQTLDD